MKIDVIEAKLLRKTLENALRIFEKDLSRPQIKAVKTLARGILRKTTTVLAGMHEGTIQKHKFIEKISYHLGKISLAEEVENKATRCVKKTLKKGEMALASYDESDIFKPDAKKMPGLSYIRDGSTGLTGNGYIMRGVNINGISLLSSLDPVELQGMDDDPSAEKILYTMRAAHDMIDHDNVLWLADRGSDNIDVFDGLIADRKQFIIRARKNRKIWDCEGKLRKVTTFEEGKHMVVIEKGTIIRLHVIQSKKHKEPIRLFYCRIKVTFGESSSRFFQGLFPFIPKPVCGLGLL